MDSSFEKLKNLQIILASTSALRKQILTQMGLDYSVFPPNFAEDFRHSDYPLAEDYCRATCEAKMQDVSGRIHEIYKEKDYLIVCADTIVVGGDGKTIYEKPVDRADSERMLREIRGNTITVVTAVNCVLYRNGNVESVSFVEKTYMRMANFNEDLLQGYLSTGAGMTHSGSLSYHKEGLLLVNSVEGCFYNIIGFPAARFYSEVTKLLNN